jgi:hypothetical protein
LTKKESREWGKRAEGAEEAEEAEGEFRYIPFILTPDSCLLSLFFTSH